MAKDELEQRLLEPTSVQLTRIEGVVNLILFRMDDVVTRVISLERTEKNQDKRLNDIEAEAILHRATATAIKDTLEKVSLDAFNRSKSKWSRLSDKTQLVVGFFTIVGIISAIYFGLKGQQ